MGKLQEEAINATRLKAILTYMSVNSSGNRA